MTGSIEVKWDEKTLKRLLFKDKVLTIQTVGFFFFACTLPKSSFLGLQIELVFSVDIMQVWLTRGQVRLAKN